MSSSATLSKRVGEDWIPPLSDYAGSMPPLPPVKAVNPDIYVGPTEESNWVIFGKLLVGAYPSSVHDDVNTRILSGILRLGVTTFVCLQQEYVCMVAIVFCVEAIRHSVLVQIST